MSAFELLAGRYELGDMLGFGGMSEVHLALDTLLGRDVAVKILRADLARDPIFYTRFRREAQNAASLNHPSIVAVYDTGEADTDSGPLPFIVMEYVNGRTLRDIVRAEGPMVPRRALSVMADACAAIDYSHGAGIIHRDIKPANIMITQTGVVKVMDFGIARAVNDSTSAMTQTSAVIGTAQYLSPEQARGEHVDARSDVYATGCVLYEILTGQPPFTGDSPVSVAYQHVRELPKPPSTYDERLAGEIDAVVLKALAKSPEDRYQSAAEMRADLVTLMHGNTPLAALAADGAPAGSATDADAPGAGPRQAADATRGDGRPRLIDAPDARSAPSLARRLLLVAGIIVVIASLVGASMYWLSDSRDSIADAVTIPEVVGLQEVEARGRLASAGFDVKVSYEANPTVAEGTVIRTEPVSGARAARGSSVKLIVSGGAEQVRVPDLTGLTETDARRQAEQAGLRLKIDDRREGSSTVPNDRVASQDPRGGGETRLPRGAHITVRLSSGPAERPVPDVAGSTFENARRTLEDAGFQVERQDVSDRATAGIVVSTAPGAGGKAREGEVVVVKVSKGDRFVVPDLRGKNPEDARRALRAAGWQGSNLRENRVSTLDLSRLNTVSNQQPSAGQEAGVNDTIVVEIFQLVG